MCVILYSPKGEIPLGYLLQSCANNPHGWGYMFNCKGSTTVRRGMDARALLKVWKRDSWDFTGRPVVFHARWTTHGKTSVDNCHPFEIPGHDLHVAHNGMIDVSIPKESERSDTFHFTNDVLAHLPQGFLENSAITRLIERYIGWSKLVFLSSDDRVYMINGHLGHWVNGIWASNSGYLPPAPKLPPIQPAKTTDLVDYGELFKRKASKAPAKRKASKRRKANQTDCELNREDCTDCQRSCAFDPFPVLRPRD